MYLPELVLGDLAYGLGTIFLLQPLRVHLRLGKRYQDHENSARDSSLQR